MIKAMGVALSQELPSISAVMRLSKQLVSAFEYFVGMNILGFISLTIFINHVEFYEVF